MSMSRNDREIHEMVEKETPKKIVVSFVMAIIFGVAAGLAAIAFRETCQWITLAVIEKMLASGKLMATQPGGIKNMSAIIALAVMLLGWVISFLCVWHKMENRGNVKLSVRYGIIATIAALVLFGAFEIIGFAISGDWLHLSGAIF